MIHDTDLSRYHSEGHVGFFSCTSRREPVGAKKLETLGLRAREGEFGDAGHHAGKRGGHMQHRRVGQAS
jgi:hypothetical protein